MNKHRKSLSRIFFNLRFIDRMWIAVFMIMALTAIIRLRLLQFPLERDEGEFAYTGQLMLQGIPPYCMAYNMKFPGIYAAYALIMAMFGQSVGGIHLGLLLVNTATIILIFILGRRLFDSTTGAAAAVCYGILSVGKSILGLQAHATHFVVLPAIGGLLLLLKAMDSGRLRLFFWSGILFGIALLMKQPGVFYGIFGLLYLMWCETRERPIEWRRAGARAGLVALGGVLPFVLTCLVLWISLVFPAFWLWTVDYARQYGQLLSLSVGWQMLIMTVKEVITPSWPLWVLGIIGLSAIAWDKRVRAKSVFLIGFLIFSFIAVCPGFYFREHYFILLLPSASLFAGAAIGAARRSLSNRGPQWLGWLAPAVILCLAAGYPIASWSDFYFKMTPVEACRSIYSTIPFPESLEIAKYIRQHTAENDTIGIIGSEPQIYFYSHRHSATGYLYVYPMVERQKYAGGMQQDMINQITRNKPQYLVITTRQDSWGAFHNSPMLLIDWARNYGTQYYDLVGLLDWASPSPESAEFHWGKNAIEHIPCSPEFVCILKRKAPGPPNKG